MADAIVVSGAREHNLKNITVEIPRDQLVVITGLSGSGKSSLAFDTIYAEGQRRYVESLSAYARQFLEQMEKPDVDSIDGLSPAICDRAEVDQQEPALDRRHGHRDLRLPAPAVRPHRHAALLAAAGEPIAPQTVQQIVDRVLALPERHARAHPGADRARPQGRVPQGAASSCARPGFVRARIDGELRDLAEDIALAQDAEAHHRGAGRPADHPRPASRSAWPTRSSVAFKYGNDVVKVAVLGERRRAGERDAVQPDASPASTAASRYPELTPRLFSFNSPHGACPTCSGLGTTNYFDPELIVPDETQVAGRGRRRAVGAEERRAHPQRACSTRWRSTSRSRLDTPFKELPKAARDGDAPRHRRGGDPLRLRARRASATSSAAPFEGVIPNLERRYKETDSEWVREELEQLHERAPLPDLQRRAAEARGAGGAAARQDDHRGARDVDRRGARSSSPTLDADARRRRRSRERMLREIARAARLPARRRPRLPDPRAHAPRRCRAARRSASGWRPRSAPA